MVTKNWILHLWDNLWFYLTVKGHQPLYQLLKPEYKLCYIQKSNFIINGSRMEETFLLLPKWRKSSKRTRTFIRIILKGLHKSCSLTKKASGSGKPVTRTLPFNLDHQKANRLSMMNLFWNSSNCGIIKNRVINLKKINLRNYSYKKHMRQKRFEEVVAWW